MTVTHGDPHHVCTREQSRPADTVRVRVPADEVMWGEFSIDALRAAAAPDAGGIRYVVALQDPVRANVLPPWTVVGVSVALVGGVEALALFFERRRANGMER